MARWWWVALLGLFWIRAPHARAQILDRLAPTIAPGDAPPAIEPPAARGIDPRCAEGAHELWRGREEEAVRLAREAIARAGSGTPSDSARHALARCHALLGRALLAGGTRDRRIHASADGALRRAFALEPSPDLIDEIVSVHWIGGGGPELPIPARSAERASPAEHAAIALRPGSIARTLRNTPTAGGPTWSLIHLASRTHEEIVAVACLRSRCLAEPLFAAWSSASDPEVSTRALARIASAGFVPIEGGLALVVRADHRVEGARTARDRTVRTDWDGSAIYVRWLDPDGELAGWNVLTRSRLRAWDRALGDGPPARVEVRVRWGRRRVIVQPMGRTVLDRLERFAGLRDPRALATDRAWLGDLRPGGLFLPAP